MLFKIKIITLICFVLGVCSIFYLKPKPEFTITPINPETYSFLKVETESYHIDMKLKNVRFWKVKEWVFNQFVDIIVEDIGGNDVQMQNL